MRNAQHYRVGFDLINSSVMFKAREAVVPLNPLLNPLLIWL